MPGVAATVPGSRPATLCLVDGRERRGVVRAFQVRDQDIWLEHQGGDAASCERIDARDVCWIGFQRGDDAPAAPATGAIRVHSPQGRIFLVSPITDVRDPVGFRAAPLEPGSPFEEMFFYRHGFKRIERDVLLGSLLMSEGAIASEDLERGLHRQQALRRRRIGEILLEQKRLQPGALEQALALQQRRHIRLGEALIEAGLAQPGDVEAALDEQRHGRDKRIGTILVEMGVVDARTLAMTLARKCMLPFVDLDDCVIDAAAVSSVPRSLIETHGVLPIEIDDEWITVALSDPLNTEPIDLIRFVRREKLREVVATAEQIAAYAEELLPEDEEEKAAWEGGRGFLPRVEVDERAEEGDEDAGESLSVSDEDGAIIHLASQIIGEAVRRGASDIHIEPNGSQQDLQVRFRVDGQCLVLPPVPAALRHALVSRFKVMARLDIAEKRKPQDGKIRVRLGGRTVELRVATLPTISGEDLVMRVLAASRPLPVAGLDLSERNRAALEDLVRRPHGLILCVGPTGSGKTTSLHSLIGSINAPERKIWTAEDPVEITQQGLRQVQVHRKIGFGFAEALRAFLRADPDVIMVGEMRDLETASIAVEASLTGHLVFSTLHTNSAPETVVRLIEMGLDPFSFGDALLGVLAQRLVRRLCERCRTMKPSSDADMEALREALAGDPLAREVGRLTWRAEGCETCSGCGYRGRLPLHELLVVDDPIRRAIHEAADADRLRRLAKEGGMTTLLQDGARKCLDGNTDLEQVLGACVR